MQVFEGAQQPMPNQNVPDAAQMMGNQSKMYPAQQVMGVMHFPPGPMDPSMIAQGGPQQVFPG